MCLLIGVLCRLHLRGYSCSNLIAAMLLCCMAAPGWCLLTVPVLCRTACQSSVAQTHGCHAGTLCLGKDYSWKQHRRLLDLGGAPDPAGYCAVCPWAVQLPILALLSMGLPLHHVRLACTDLSCSLPALA